MALVKKAVRNGAVCYHHDSKEIFVLLCLFLPQGLTLCRAWDLGEEKDKEVQKFPVNRCYDKPRRCEQHF